MRFVLFLAAISSLVACTPYEFLANRPGVDKVDWRPEPTALGGEPVMLGANIVSTDQESYIELMHSGPTTHVFLEFVDEVDGEDTEAYLLDLDEVPQMDACDWIDKQWDTGIPGLSLYSCSQACVDACACYTSCSELPGDLGVIGGPNMLCTAACSQADTASLTPTEFADTFADIYGCQPSTCSNAGEFFSNYVEINREFPDVGSAVAYPVSAPPAADLTSGPLGSGTLVGGGRGCVYSHN